MLNELEKKLCSHFDDACECDCLICSVTRRLARPKICSPDKLALTRKTFITYMVYMEPSYANWLTTYKHFYMGGLHGPMCSVCKAVHDTSFPMCRVCGGFNDATFHMSWDLPHGPTAMMSRISEYRLKQITEFAMSHMLEVGLILAKHAGLPVTAVEIILPLLFPIIGPTFLEQGVINKIANMCYC